MAEWEHKEEFWQPQRIESHDMTTRIHQWVKEKDRAIFTTKTFTRKQALNSLSEEEKEKITKDNQTTWHQQKACENENITFPEFLDLHCKGGWEVFKISRDFRNGSGTWCIFRRLV